jgi:hypothetical protein
MLALSAASFAAAADDGHDSHKHATAAAETAGEHSHGRSEIHGGSSVMTAENHFELLFTTDEARLYVYDGSQAPVRNLEGVNVMLTLATKDSKVNPLSMAYVKADPKKGVSQDYFVARHDFKSAGGNAAKAMVRVEGLGKKPVEFKSAVVLGEQAAYTCAMHPEVKTEEPGSCPKCGMPLHKVERVEEHEHDAKHDAGTPGAHDQHH